jgi:hypothetical protein
MTDNTNILKMEDEGNEMWKQHLSSLRQESAPEDKQNQKSVLLSNFMLNQYTSDEFLDELFIRQENPTEPPVHSTKKKKNKSQSKLASSNEQEDSSRSEKEVSAIALAKNKTETETETDTQSLKEVLNKPDDTTEEVIYVVQADTDSIIIEKNKDTSLKVKSVNSKKEKKKEKKKKKVKQEEMMEEKANSETSKDDVRNFREWLSTQKPLKESQLRGKDKKKKKKKKLSDAEKLAADSLKMSEGVVSESYAKLLAKQGYIEQAEEMYRKLILKNPEKSSYFAAELENLKNNK